MTGRVLVADDEEDMRVLLEVVLRGAGFEVLVAADGAEALALWSEHRDDPLHAVVLDQRMPGASGAEVASAILDERPEQRVLVVSAQVDDELRGEAAAVGVRAVLDKDQLLGLGQHEALLL